MTNKNYKHWRVEHDNEGIAWLHIDKADAGTNVLSREVLEELEDIIGGLTQTSPKGVVILSDKDSGFIAGADVKEFTKIESEDQALQAVRRGHSVFNALEALPCPTVALIHGFCLGGGLELALACRYRVADDDPGCKLGLPEVKLGIHPGFGGTVRMIKLVGPLNGLDAMLTGRNLSARAAKKIGLVNYAVPKRHHLSAARSLIKEPPKPHKLPWWTAILNHRQVRPLLGKYMAKQVAKKAARSHYPAPYAIIDLWVRCFDDPGYMLNEEINSIAELIVGKTAQNLIRVFMLNERLKSLGRSEDYDPKHVHVIGGGVMGGDIAIWCALQGFKVTLQDQKMETLAKVVQRAFKLYQKKLKDRRAIRAALDRLVPDIKGDGIPWADIVIEAIFEDAEVKRNLFAGIEPKLKKDTIIATNTSSIPLDELNTVLKKPERLVGLHFFNPVAMMPLVEIVHSEKTSDKVSQMAAAFTRRINKLPLPVTSTPGFLVNRVLMPYLMEAVNLVEENVPMALIDKEALAYGMPMGPIELADTVGLDICLKVAEILSEHMDIAVPERLKKMVEKGQLGKKSGKGFYVFKNGKPVKPPIPKNYTAPTDVQDRLILRMINEAVACLRDGVVDDAELADAGIIFGTGFAPFRGGPFHYIESRGKDQVVKLLEQLEHRYGPRFAADKGWKDL
ncbi:MAG: 3-hydroxyacyl-CoA dehydrogenase NAD-binding domain-containing protein [Gammaproteobacteria bacterium]|nr:3-hydroxyacyl-CoA dehydrogenase NAD-binding domain-containing protein [Gammaproteobacteria bacterium]MDH5652693.1 3-hydroxyacyl-CoA dehydrogenase NAD-binding domain-containing protein [Gammaproteobacteria bacterium]